MGGYRQYIGKDGYRIKEGLHGSESPSYTGKILYFHKHYSPEVSLREYTLLKRVQNLLMKVRTLIICFSYHDLSRLSIS